MDTQASIERSQLQPGRYTWLARVPFLLAGVGGGLLLIALKYFGVPQLEVTGAAVLLIVGYWVIVGLTPILKLREDQLADNCYYLGFLYTLVSLAWALWDFTRTGSESDIVSNFGLALGSTITGILLRVTINQARRDVLETEEDVRMALVQSVVRLRVQIDDAVLALASFHKQTEQVARDAIQRSADEAATALDASITKVGEASSGVMERIEQAFAEFTESAQQLNAASSGTVKGLKALLTRIERIEAPNDIVLRRLEPALTAVAAVTDRLKERLELDGRMLEDAQAQSQRAVEQFSQALGGFAELERNMVEAARQSARAFHAVEGTNEQFRNLTEQTRNAVALQSDLTAAARQQSEAANKASQAQLDAVVGTFRSYNDALAIELERCRRMVAGTGNALAELVESLGDKLERTMPLATQHLDVRE